MKDIFLIAANSFTALSQSDAYLASHSFGGITQLPAVDPRFSLYSCGFNLTSLILFI